MDWSYWLGVRYTPQSEDSYFYSLFCPLWVALFSTADCEVLQNLALHRRLAQLRHQVVSLNLTLVP